MNANALVEVPAVPAVEAEPYALTAIDCAALRKATCVIFRHVKGESRIEAVKELERTTQDPFATEARVVIPCDWKLTDYGRIGDGIQGYGREKGANFTAFAWESCAQYVAEWLTIAAIIKAGDALTLHWKRDTFRTEGLESVNYHGDSLTLEVQRKDKRLSFHVESSVCPDNSARMIRRA